MQKKILIGEHWEMYEIGESKFKLGNLHLLQS